MPGTRKLCEFIRTSNNTACGDVAGWLVRVGTRTTDEQLTCDVHLADTCQAMYEAEGRRGAVVQLSNPHATGVPS
jgi:hypothetical protein